MNSANQGRWGDPWPSTSREMLKVEADFSHWNDNPCRPRMDTPLLHVGDELKFTDVDGKAYILKVIREAED